MSFITVIVDINGIISVVCDGPTANKFSNREAVTAATSEVRRLLEDRYAGHLMPLGDIQVHDTKKERAPSTGALMRF
jgi:hypothetical protein